MTEIYQKRPKTTQTEQKRPKTSQNDPKGDLNLPKTNQTKPN